MNHFATIITQNHLDKALALLHSLQQFGEAELHVYIVDVQISIEKMEHPGLTIHRPEELMAETVDKIIHTKYLGHSTRNRISLPKNGIIAFHDYLRWALKPAFVKLLHQQHQRVIYCDCDLYFYNDYQFLLDMLDKSRIVLSPHWREITPIANTDYRYTYLHGLYNGGFFATRDADDFLTWWREMCAIECTAESVNGTYVDQKYLDIVPLYFDGVDIIRHSGCNVAGWNICHLKRTVDNDIVLVDGKPIIFIHFSPVTINKIVGGEDLLLRNHLEDYENQLQKIRINLTRKGLKTCISISNIKKTEII